MSVALSMKYRTIWLIPMASLISIQVHDDNNHANTSQGILKEF